MTGFAEILGHRVVTLHPAVHGGILARRDVAEDVADLEAHGIQPIDLVCVNLYPFEQTVGRLDVTWDDVIEQIDVGGPALLRAAAKNHAHVIPSAAPRTTTACSTSCGQPATSPARAGVRSPRAHSRRPPSYDSAVATWFSGRSAFPTRSCRSSTASSISHTARTRTSAPPTTAQRGARTHLLARVEQLHGKQLSFNNLNDLSAGRLLALELDSPGCVIVKHANPCGVGIAPTIEAAYEKALAADPSSAYGGVVASRIPSAPRSVSGSPSSSSRSSSRRASTPLRSRR